MLQHCLSKQTLCRRDYTPLGYQKGSLTSLTASLFMSWLRGFKWLFVSGEDARVARERRPIQGISAIR